LFGAAVNGVVSRTVRDTAAFLDVISGAEQTGPFVVAAPQRPYREEVAISRAGVTPATRCSGQPYRCAVRPLQVVEHDQQTARSGRSDQGLGGDLERPEPLLR
jgi:amidase